MLPLPPDAEEKDQLVPQKSEGISVPGCMPGTRVDKRQDADQKIRTWKDLCRKDYADRRGSRGGGDRRKKRRDEKTEASHIPKENRKLKK